MSDIAGSVKAIIVDKLGVDENEVTMEASFTNDLGADSLASKNDANQKVAINETNQVKNQEQPSCEGPN
jgi:hypothetical protein